MASARETWNSALIKMEKELNELVDEQNVRDDFDHEKLREIATPIFEKIKNLKNVLLSWDPKSNPGKYDEIHSQMVALTKSFEKLKKKDDKAKRFYMELQKSAAAQGSMVLIPGTEIAQHFNKTPTLSVANFLSLFCCGGNTKNDYEKIHDADPRLKVGIRK